MIIERDAEFSPDDRHRRTLTRIWDRSKGFIFYCGLNPSKAGKKTDDMTVKKGIGFAVKLGFGGTLHGNAYSLVSTDPDQLFGGTDVLDPLNDDRLVEMASRAGLVVVCWGEFPDFDERFAEVTDLLSRFSPKCFGRTREGYPKHISRIAYSTKLEDWRRP
jgi:hypothetical protein